MRWPLHPLLIVLSGLTFACANPDVAPLRLGISQWPPYEFFRLASHSEAGLLPAEVRVVDLFTPVDLLQAFELGQVDALACTLVEFLQIVDKGGRDPVIIGIIDASMGGDVVLGPDSLTGPADLRGLRIGVEAGTVGEVLLAGALGAGGLSPGDVLRVPFHLQLDQGPLSENGLDAVVCFPPFSTALMRHGNLKILYDSARLAQPLFDVLVVERGMLKERPEVLRQLLVAFHKAKILREQRPDWADSLMAKWEGVSLAEFRQTFNGIKLHDLASQPAMLEKEVPASLDYVRDLLVEQGLLNGALPSPGDAVDSRPAREAARGN